MYNGKKLIKFLLPIAICYMAFTSVSCGKDNNRKKEHIGKDEIVLNKDSYKLNRSNNILNGTTKVASKYSNIYFAFDEIKPSLTGWQTINDGGYFYNVSSLRGIESIKIDSSKNLNLSYGYNEDCFYETNYTLQSNIQYNFNNEHPYFIEISNNTGSPVTINELIINYDNRINEEFEDDDYDIPQFTSVDKKYKYSYVHGGIKITKYNGTYEDLIEVPSKIDGKNVIEIGSNSFKKSYNTARRNVQETSSDNHVFFIPQSIIIIQNNSFDIGNIFTTDGDKINKGWIDDAIKNNGQQFSNIIFNIKPENLHFSNGIVFLFDRTSSSMCLIANLNILPKVVIPDYVDNIPVTEIYNYSFSYCAFLKEVVLPSELIILSRHAFYQCPNLEKIDCSKLNKNLSYFNIDISSIPTLKDVVTPIGYAPSLKRMHSTQVHKLDRLTVNLFDLKDKMDNIIVHDELYVNATKEEYEQEILSTQHADWLDNPDLKITFNYLPQQQINNYINFKNASIGQKVRATGGIIATYTFAFLNDPNTKPIHVKFYKRLYDTGIDIKITDGVIINQEGVKIIAISDYQTTYTKINPNFYFNKTTLKELEASPETNIGNFIEVDLTVATYLDINYFFYNDDGTINETIRVFHKYMHHHDYATNDKIKIKGFLHRYGATYELISIEDTLVSKAEAIKCQSIEDTKQFSYLSTRIKIKGYIVSYREFCDMEGNLYAYQQYDDNIEIPMQKVCYFEGMIVHNLTENKNEDKYLEITNMLEETTEACPELNVDLLTIFQIHDNGGKLNRQIINFECSLLEFVNEDKPHKLKIYKVEDLYSDETIEIGVQTNKFKDFNFEKEDKLLITGEVAFFNDEVHILVWNYKQISKE